MSPAAPHSHRSGKLKQQNKKNKRSNASKRSLNRRAGGKIQSVKGANTTTGSKAKADRVNEARQRRDLKKKELLENRRGLHISGVSKELGKIADRTARPRVVGIISLSEDEEGIEERVRDILIESSDRHVICSSSSRNDVKSSVTVHYGANKKSSPTSGNLTLLTNSSSFRSQYTQKGYPNLYADQDASIQSALDLCRVCDLVMFIVDGRSVINSIDNTNCTLSGDGMSIAATSIKTSANTAHLDHVISERGDRILTAIKSQGLPTPVTLIVHGDSSVLNGPEDVIVMEAEEEDGQNEQPMSLDMGCATSQHTFRSAKSIQRNYLRRRAELKRYTTRLAITEFGENNCKIMELELGSSSNACVVETSSFTHTSANTESTTKTQQTSILALVRTLCTIAASGPTWVSDAPRPYLITDGTANSEATLAVSGAKVDVGPSAVSYDSNSQELKLTGYIYSNSIPWNTNHLVHVPHLGTYPVKNIAIAGLGNEILPPIIAAERKNRVAKGSVEMQDADSGVKVLAQPNLEYRESLDMFAAPDALEGEQNLIGFDEHDNVIEDNAGDDGKYNTDTFQPGTERPAGWSDYQSAWLDAIDETEDVFDHGELAFDLNKKRGDENVGEDDAIMDDDMEVNDEDRRALLAQRKKGQKDDLEFPDEVAVEEEGAARDRYARYRSLKSFRKSHWDPKENLPDTYGAVYHFSSFKATQKDVMADAKDLNEIVKKHGFGSNLIGGTSEGEDDKMDSYDEDDDVIARACVPIGAYVTITLENVSPQVYSRVSPDVVLTAVALLPHENKVSVLHANLSQTSKCDVDKEVPVKSKDVLTFRCGWKTWKGRPIFSQNNLNSDKHKFERFMPVGGAFFACTMFGPVTYSPCPVLVFRETEESEEGDGKKRELLAHGSMIGADADRIVLKRIILTGYPTRVHKRHATVKYMFYNPEDVKWFQPAGLSTKHGLQGNIIQSVGDHGVMKCLFNAPIKQHDTVCLPLYKRVYPKFAAEKQGSGDDTRSCMITNQLKVV